MSLTGVRKLNAKLRRLKQGAANKILRPAIRAGNKVAVKAVKDSVPSNLRGAKSAIGSSLSKVKRGNPSFVSGKVGAGVGKKTKNKDGTPKVSKKVRKKPGVGISARNIHWFFLGTGSRVNGIKNATKRAGVVSFTNKALRYTGAMPPQIKSVKATVMRKQGAIRRAIAAKVKEGIWKLVK